MLDAPASVFNPKVDPVILRNEPAQLATGFQYVNHKYVWGAIRDAHYDKIDRILTSLKPGMTLSFGCSYDRYRRHVEFTKNEDGSWASGHGLHDSNWNVINAMLYYACGRSLPCLRIYKEKE